MDVQIISGKFAEILGRNMTSNWMVDGDDLQDRADAVWQRGETVLGGYSDTATILQRGIDGVAIQYGNHPYVFVYNSRAAAEAALATQNAR